MYEIYSVFSLTQQMEFICLSWWTVIPDSLWTHLSPLGSFIDGLNNSDKFQCLFTPYWYHKSLFPLLNVQKKTGLAVILVRLAHGWHLESWISWSFPLPWLEWLMVPKLFVETIWFVLNTCFPLQSLEFWYGTGTGCLHVFVQSLSQVWLFWDPMDYSPPGNSVHGISQVRILEWIARGSSQPRDWTHVSCIGKWILYHWAIRGAFMTRSQLHLWVLKL